MAEIPYSQQTKLELLFQMPTGYVLDFNDRTYRHFVQEHTGIDIDEPRFRVGGTSKANRTRTFWKTESAYSVAKLINALIDHAREMSERPDAALLAACEAIASRIGAGAELPTFTVPSGVVDSKDLEVLAQQVREAIMHNRPQTGLDRLHTLVTKYLRQLCQKHGLDPAREKPLHSLMGEYVKTLTANGHIESEMTRANLKSDDFGVRGLQRCAQRAELCA